METAAPFVHVCAGNHCAVCDWQDARRPASPSGHTRRGWREQPDYERAIARMTRVCTCAWCRSQQRLGQVRADVCGKLQRKERA